MPVPVRLRLPGDLEKFITEHPLEADLTVVNLLATLHIENKIVDPLEALYPYRDQISAIFYKCSVLLFNGCCLLNAYLREQEGPVVKPRDDVCIPRSADLLESLGSPGGLLPFKDIQECGFDKTTGLGDVGIPSLGFLCKLHITLF